jgi:hypothetical protein
MTYILPQPYSCPKCGHTEQYSPHAYKHSDHPVIGGDPVCPVCYLAFISANVPTMKCTIDFSKKTSDENKRT